MAMHLVPITSKLRAGVHEGHSGAGGRIATAGQVNCGGEQAAGLGWIVASTAEVIASSVVELGSVDAAPS